MGDSIHEIGRTDSFILARLLALGRDGGETWTDADLEAMTTHLLERPLVEEVSGDDPRSASTIRGHCESVEPVIRTFSDLFAHPSPPLELLKLVKDFAKSSRVSATAEGRTASGVSLPKPVSAVLYHVAIAAAQKHHAVRITRLDEGSCRDALEWVVAQSWVPADLKAAVLERFGAP